jgi:hypothetical protein
MIDPVFLNDEIYSIHSAAARLVGPEKQKEIVELSGEVMFSELEKRLKLDTLDPIGLVRELISYLERVGYFSKGKVEQISENELVIHMHDAACHDGVVKLKNEGAYPPHFCTVLIFAGLKKMFDIQVELTHLDLGPNEPPYHSIEKWILKKAEGA